MQEHRSVGVMNRFLGGLVRTMRRLLFRVIAVGPIPIPQQIAFIMDGNRRIAKKWQLEEGAGHKAGFLALMAVLKYCYEKECKYVTVYAFSIDNFSRSPDQVQYLMELMHEKIEAFMNEVDIVNNYGVRVVFVGDLDRLYEPVKIAAQQAMAVTAHNTKTYLLICEAYSSSHEIQHAVSYACKEKSGGVQALANPELLTRVLGRGQMGRVGSVWVIGAKKEWGLSPKANVRVLHTAELNVTELSINGNGNVSHGVAEVIKVMDLEKHMYMGVVPDPEILVRSLGETRLSNFLLWQSTNSVLYSPKALWPGMGLRGGLGDTEVSKE
uniref:Alkyl transferase n=1 Tax=Tanacetum cinerariifolium TaxID=118510 RepID=A0A6L2LHT5_TANCI|nr:rubber cis-polyprenyltransferase HRT2 [Tanacetum cinerariifolium]